MFTLILALFGFGLRSCFIITPMDKVNERFPNFGFTKPNGTKAFGVILIMCGVAGHSPLRLYLKNQMKNISSTTGAFLFRIMVC